MDSAPTDNDPPSRPPIVERFSEIAQGGREGHRVPRGTAELGMWLFLAALAALFLASMIGYAIIRIQGSYAKTNALTGDRIPPVAPPAGSIEMPWLLAISTVLILASSYTIHQALVAVRRERQAALRHWLMLTVGLTAGFLITQTPAMLQLLTDEALAEAGYSSRLFQLAFFLVLVHALHVIGGVIPLLVITKRALDGKYDHEFYTPVKLTVMYWHFLDVVWLFMFAALIVSEYAAATPSTVG
ncbi:MAG: cytochrome c oxidase subunit 3 [Planctomycetota bacterium]